MRERREPLEKRLAEELANAEKTQGGEAMQERKDIQQLIEAFLQKAETSELVPAEKLKRPLRIRRIFWKSRQMANLTPYSLLCYPLREIGFYKQAGQGYWRALITIAVLEKAKGGSLQRDFLRVSIPTNNLPPMVAILEFSEPKLVSAVRSVYNDDSKAGTNIYRSGEPIRIDFYGLHSKPSFKVFLVKDMPNFESFALTFKGYLGDLIAFRDQLERFKGVIKPEALVKLYERVFFREILEYEMALEGAGMTFAEAEEEQAMEEIFGEEDSLPENGLEKETEERTEQSPNDEDIPF